MLFHNQTTYESLNDSKNPLYELENIHNYYEKPVMQALISQQDKFEDKKLIADAACIALNLLPSKYIHHEIDMAFYASKEELTIMDLNVKRAVKDAIEIVTEHPEH